MKRLNVETVLTDLDGEPLKGTKGDILLKGVLCDALMFVNPDPQKKRATGEEMVALHELALKINKPGEGGVVELSTEECTLAKTKAAEALVPLIYGQVHRIFEE